VPPCLASRQVTGVPLFASLDIEQIYALVDEMVPSDFDEGAFVFEQGDVGDTFFVILSGEAEVLRDDHGLADEPGASQEILFEDPEKRLCLLSAYAYFGERALLKKEPRYASVRALCALSTMCLTEAGCERALGKPLKDCVPDIY
jgi:CRP-like cAMP-binding protein